MLTSHTNLNHGQSTDRTHARTGPDTRAQAHNHTLTSQGVETKLLTLLACERLAALDAVWGPKLETPSSSDALIRRDDLRLSR